MLIGDRIALRRKELGMTQTELAMKMGYKSKAAISKIETNVNDITQSVVVKFADALDTSIAYLMGWEDAPAPPPAPALQLNAEEEQLVRDYRDASEEIRGAAATMLHTSAETNRRDRSETA